MRIHTHRSPQQRPRIKNFLLLITSLTILYLLPYRFQPPVTTTTTTTTILPSPSTTNTTTIHHILFSIASSSRSYPNRQPYLRLWYNPQTTRVYVFLDRPATNSDATLPPIIISGDTSQFPYTFPRGHRSAVRVARIVKEAVDLNESDVRWFVFGDDDTVFFTDNLVRRLSSYDHDKWYYIGSNSESYTQNEKFSFNMAFGGGGFAISRGLARVLARVLDSCLMRYPHLYGSDARIFSCLAELGVELTHEPGFHQIDVRGDIFGMLSAHPLSPLLSLHHVDTVDPIFPGMSRPQAMEHLFYAADSDPARILQRTVCYDKAKYLTVSIAWGYVVQVFERNHLLPDLLPLQKTFRPWKSNRDYFSNRYMFNTRDYPSDPCERPIAFFMETVFPETDGLYTFYKRNISENCSRTKSIQSLELIQLHSRNLVLNTGEVMKPRRHCCDIVLASDDSNMKIYERECRVDELISMFV